MRIIITKIFPSIVFILIFACSKPKDTTPPTLEVSTTNILLHGEANAVDSFVISTNGSWTIEVNPSTAYWLKLNVKSGTGDKKIRISVLDQNFSGAERTANVLINFTDGSAEAKEVTVVQKASTLPIWMKTYGGSSSDQVTSVCPTSDGGFVIAANSNSTDFDVADINRGNLDIWVSKLDAGGNKIWSKTYGGTYIDMVNEIAPTTDGGFIMTGRTWSSDGDFTGFKGNTDVFVIRLDANGKKIWSKTFGGTDGDEGFSVAQMKDGNYLVAGSSEKNDGDFDNLSGQQNLFLMKLATDGSVVWVKDMPDNLSGRANSIFINIDGSFVISGASDRTGNSTQSGTNAWVMKLSEDANLVWFKLYGGSGSDFARSIKGTTDGGYIVAGYTNSNNGDVSGSNGQDDAWLFKLNANGQLLWQKCYGGKSYDRAASVTVTTDGNYIFCGEAMSNDGSINGIHTNLEHGVMPGLWFWMQMEIKSGIRHLAVANRIREAQL